jgi:hypothetical protein
VTLKRLLQNVVFNSERSEMLVLFLRPPRLPDPLCFSLKYPRFVREEFLRELFGAAPVTLAITVERSIRVLLPRAVRPRSVRIE